MIKDKKEYVKLKQELTEVPEDNEVLKLIRQLNKLQEEKIMIRNKIQDNINKIRNKIQDTIQDISESTSLNVSDIVVDEYNIEITISVREEEEISMSDLTEFVDTISGGHSMVSLIPLPHEFVIIIQLKRYGIKER